MMVLELVTPVSPALVTPTEATYDKIVSDFLYNQFETFVTFWLTFLLCCLGLVTNVLNMSVFMTQGFREGANVSMMYISVWDFIKCLAVVVNRLHGPISLFSAAAATSWKNMTFSVSAYTSIFSGYVNFCITTYVSVERCLCVSRPFTFKTVVMRNVTLVAMIVISGVVFGAFFLMYFIYEVVFIFNPDFNSTMAVYRYSSFYYQTSQIIMPYYRLIGIIIPFASFLILCFSSFCTVFFLRKSSTFLSLQKDTREDKSSFSAAISRREKQVIKMLLSVIFTTIANLLPRIVLLIAQLLEPELFLLRRYHNVYSVVAACLFALDILRASVNFFIFLFMSSQFKQTFYTKYNVNSFATCQKK